MMACTSAAFIAGGFSEKTCFPASRHWMVRGAWNLLGTMMLTASISGLPANISSTES